MAQFFIGWMPFLSPSQQYHSGTVTLNNKL